METVDRNCQAMLFTAQELQDAFREGFDAGRDRGNLRYKYPPVAVAWMESESRGRIGPVEDRPLSREFDALKTKEREAFDPPMEVLP